MGCGSSSGVGVNEASKGDKTGDNPSSKSSHFHRIKDLTGDDEKDDDDTYYAPVRDAFNHLWKGIKAGPNQLKYIDNGINFVLTAKTGPETCYNWFKTKMGANGRWENGGFNPTKNSVVLMSYADVHKGLSLMGDKVGSEDNETSEWFRTNQLGFGQLNTIMWPERSNKMIGLSCPPAEHAFVRPLLTDLCGPVGPWDQHMVRGMVQQFFRGRQSFVVGKDVSNWNFRLLHKVLLGLDIAEDEANTFRKFVGKAVMIIGAPSLGGDGDFLLADALGAKDVMKQKELYMSRYSEALKTHHYDGAKFTRTELIKFTSATLDALMFAGGLSVPATLGWMFGIVYSKRGREQWLPKDFDLRTIDVTAFIFEVIRFFNPVTGVCYTVRGKTPDSNSLHYMNLQTAARDTSVWGEDAERFRIRPLSDYHKFFLGFADNANNPKIGSPNSRSCPGKDLAMCTIEAFFRGWLAEAGDQDVLHYWKTATKPEDVKVDGYATSTFAIGRESALSNQQVQQTKHFASDTLQLDGMDKEELAALDEAIGKIGKFASTDSSTRLWFNITKATHSSHFYTAEAVKAVFQAKRKLPLGDTVFGIKFTNDDENTEISTVGTFGKSILFGSVNIINKEGDRKLEDLKFFDSDQEAHLTARKAFGKLLPAQFDDLGDPATDQYMVDCCFRGIGQWYLRTVTAVKHAIPPGTEVEVNVEHLGQFPTRKPYVRYGATAYFKLPEGSAQKAELLGVYVCEYNKLFTAQDEDAEWSHAKAVFRSSVITDLTFRHHLCTVHWIWANGLMYAARETLDANHPVRRLLKQFYFLTADINWASYPALLKIGSLAFRTFGFTEEGWVAYAKESIKEFKFETFAQRGGRKLPESVYKQLPLYEDGLETWNAIRKYADSYITTFFKDDQGVQEDSELNDFYKHFEAQIEDGFALPTINKRNLVDLIAQLMFAVTACHEMVGSVVECMLHNRSFPGKLVKGETRSDVQSYCQGLTIMSLTGNRRPLLINDWRHLFQCDAWDKDTQKAAIAVVAQFRKDLIDVSELVSNRNDQRMKNLGFKFQKMNPAVMETSVSI